MRTSGHKELSFVCFSDMDWWYHSRAHIVPQLMKRFARNNKVLFINSIVMQKFNFGEGKKFIHKFIRKTKSILTGLKKVEENLWVYSPFALPVHHIWGARWLNQMFLRIQVWRVTRKLGIRNPVVLVACPAACDNAIKMGKSKLIYNRTDRTEEAEGVDVDTIVKYDKELKANADITVFVNTRLFEKESAECRNPLLLDHGVDFEIFASAEQETTIPSDIADIPKPIIGYFGAIDGHSVDITLAERIADLLPKMSFVYIGSVASDYPGLVAKKNVWMLGQKDYEDIPRYGKCFDVAILPWLKNKWTEAANPIKIKEYLALGKPFVSTPVFTEIERYLDVTYVAGTPEEFAQCIVKALNENSAERIAARRAKVKEETWDRKAQLLMEELFSDDEVLDGMSSVVRIRRRPVIGRLHLLARWSKFALKSLGMKSLDFVGSALHAQLQLIRLTLRDMISRRKNVECNICGWTGCDFYPNVGRGYDERSVLCPGCDCLDRYRSLAVILWARTRFFSPDASVVEVGPVRGFQKYCLKQKCNKNYVNFDIGRFAMERGDIMQMNYGDNTFDYFLCFHVLEHVEDDITALKEIRRVLRPGGLAVFQSPIDWAAKRTRKYHFPDPRDADHVRCYGRDFSQRISACGFEVSKVSVVECTTEWYIKRFGLSREPVFFAKKSV